VKRSLTLIIYVLIISGCVHKVHLKYNPDLEERLLEPINLKTEIKIDPIMFLGTVLDTVTLGSITP